MGVLEVELEPESGVEAVFVQNPIEPACSFSRDISQGQLIHVRGNCGWVSCSEPYWPPARKDRIFQLASPTPERR